MFSLLNSLWDKAQLYIAGGLFAVAALFCLLWILASGEAEREREARLQAEDTLEKTEEELVRYSAALEAAERRSEAREGALQELRDDESRIRQNPVTVDCVASPAIRDALGILFDRGESDPSSGDSASEPPEL